MKHKNRLRLGVAALAGVATLAITGVSAQQAAKLGGE